METITNFQTVRLTNGAHFIFIVEMLKRAKSTSAIYSTFRVQLDALDKAIAAEDAALKLSTKSLITDQIKEAADLRGKVYSSLVKRVDSFTVQTDVAEYVIPLKQLFKDYQIKPRGQREKVSGLMANLISDLRGKYSKGVSALNLSALVTELAQANQSVIDLTESRTEASKNNTVGTLKAIRKVTDRAYRDFVELLDARVRIEGDARYADFIAYLNAEILHYRREAIGQRVKGPASDGSAPSGDGGGDDGEEEPPQG
jgi:hypothetical protein